MAEQTLTTDGEMETQVTMSAEDPDKPLPWKEALDKVSSMELWGGKPREERDTWVDYLTRADELVRKPRKTIPQDVVRAILEGDMTSVDMSTVPNAQPRVAVFVSSTFTDTKAERNQLMKDVYPYLRVLCRRLGVDFGTVDMGWGITEEASNEHVTTDMCVKEIQRCVKESVGPAFLCLLGHKYGQQPLPAKIVHNEYEAMLYYLQKTGKDTSLMANYYQKDENAIPVEYVLITKTKENITWSDDVEKIKADLRAASVACFGDTDERCNKYNISIAESEIHSGAFNNPNSDYQTTFVRRELKDYSSEFHKDNVIVDMKGEDVDEDAQAMLAELRESKIRHAASRFHIFDIHYDTPTETECANYIRKVCDELCSSLVANILDTYETRLHVKEDLEFQEVVQHRDHANEKASLFVGREREIGLIKEYLASDNRKPLVVHGPSGCGKTSLMAVSTKLMKKSKDNSVVVLRFLGTTGLSGSARNVMISVCTQLSRVYGQDVSKIPAGFKDLVKYFRTCMGFATAAKPLFLVLDSLDQLSNEDFGQNLSWVSLTEDLPENVKVVVSSLPTKCLDTLNSYIQEDNFVEVQPLKSDEGPEIIKQMLQLQQRRITGPQGKFIMDAFNKCPLPLFLRLAVDVAVQWHSYDKVTNADIADNLSGLIDTLFQRLESRYGKMFVHHALSYITASKHGLSLSELEDILSCDDQVLDNVFEQPLPPVCRIPSLLWARVRNELGIYLAERGTNGISAYNWYHRQFRETAEKRYLENTFGNEEGRFRQKAHEAIADYFEGKWENGKPFVNKKDGSTKVEDRKLPKQPNVLSGNRRSGRQLNRRKFAELPYHLIRLGGWDRFQSLVMDLKYIEAEFETGNGFNCLSELIEATKLSGRDVIKQMTRFVGSNLGFLIREPKGIYQMALKESKKSAIRQLLEKIEAHEYPVQLMTNADDDDFNDPCEMTMHGHTETIRTCDFSPQGDFILSSSDDSTMRIWDSTTGAELVCVTSLAEPVWPTEDEPNQLMLHPVNHCCFSRTGETIGSGTEKGQVMLWDKSGGQIKCVDTNNKAVTFVKFSPDNTVLATSFKNGFVSFWDAGDLRTLATVGLDGVETTCVDFSPDGNTLAVTCLEDLVLIDTGSYTVRSRNPGNCELSLCCIYHPAGKQIMSGGDDSKVSIWDAATGVYQSGIKRHNAWIWCIKFTKDGNNMFTGSSDRSMKVWHRTSGDGWEVTATVGGHSHRVSMLALEGITENKLVTSSLDRSLKVWDTQTLIKGDIPPAAEGHFTTCVTSASGRYLAKSQSWDKKCVVVDLTTKQELGNTASHKGFIRKAQFTYDESRVFVLDHGHGGSYETGAEQYAKITVSTLPGTNSTCTELDVSSPVSFSLSAKYVFVGTVSGDLHLFDVNSYDEVNKWSSGTSKQICSVGASWDTDRVAACYETVCQIWDASASHCVHVKDLVEQDSEIQTCAFSPDGRVLVVGTNSGWLYAYNTSRGDVQLMTFAKDHASYILDISFSSCGTLMASSASLGMRIWDVGETITPKCAFYAPVNRADFVNEHTVVVGEATGKQLFLSF